MDKKKSILLMILFFVLGFGVGMVITFEIVFSNLEKYGIIF